MKGRKVPDPPIDHAAQLRERLGRVAYEAAFDHEPVPWTEADETRHERYRKIGQAVMDAIVKRSNTRGTISVASSYGAATKQPYVELSINVSPSQLTHGKAREIALMLLEAADAAESDAVIMEFAKTAIGLDQSQAVQLLDQFRRYREKRNGKGADTA